MQIHNKLFFLSSLLIFCSVSCQSKKIYYSKYENLPLEKKQEVNEYLKDVRKEYPKKDNEILLMLSYNCFLNQSVLINNTIKRDFPKINNTDGRTVMVLIGKEKNNIEFLVSDGKKINIKYKRSYDYISVCYNKSFKEWYIEYYNYPHLNITE